MFKKPVKSIRRRQASEDDSHGDNLEEVNVIASFKESKKKKKTDKTSQIQRAVVSFDVDEEEEECFQVKKSSQSRKITKQVEKERKDKDKEQPKTQKEDLLSESRKLKDEEVSIVVKGEIKPVKHGFEGKILTGREAEFAEDHSDEEEVEENGRSVAYRRPDPFRKVLQGGVIPDAATIHAMRKERERARETGDFLPMDDTNREEDTQKSRLVRDDDNDLSDDERIDFSVNLQAKERKSIKENFIAAQEEVLSDHGDEIEDWEAQQLKKAVKHTQQQYLRNGVGYESTASEIHSGGFVSFTPGAEPTLRDQLPPVPESREPLDPEMLRKKLQEKISSLQEVHRRHQLDYEQTINDRIETLDLIEKLEKEKPELSERYKFAQFLRGYVADLIDCLDTKMPRLETIEKGYMNILRSKSEKLIIRRRNDVMDETDECMSQGKPAVRRPEERIRRHAEREGRRSRRRRSRGSHMMPDARMLKQSVHCEGLSSDDELPESENVLFKAETERFRTEAGALFEDVTEEFSTVEGLKQNFENWRRTHLDSYRDAYVSMCLPKVFSPFVRLQLITWNPLEDSLDLEKKSWFSELMNYGYTEEETEDSLLTDPDFKLVSSIVERDVLTRFAQAVELAYDPLSTRQTRQAVHGVRYLTSNFPTVTGNSKPFQRLIRACVERLRSALDNDVFIPLYPKNIMDTKMGQQFVYRQFWSGVKLMGNILTWEGILSDDLLRTLALDNLLTRYLLLSLRSMGTITDRDIPSELEKCKYILRLLPNSWLNTTQPPLQQLAPFTRYLCFDNSFFFHYFFHPFKVQACLFYYVFISYNNYHFIYFFIPDFTFVTKELVKYHSTSFAAVSTIHEIFMF
ncbi:PAX3- and PAX7-binding protein 1-like isoform X2 [Artemia franciscana]|uniref:PAX3- and PAX7-binding protein 1-like isoform X2 n=1 Tax=Artemia franciscana TaxID=6661 RepID=UPI0032DA715E